jgi:hypothetical protein
MKQLKDFKRYYVTTDGEVYNSSNHKMTKQVNVDGYFVVNLYKDGKYFHKRLCRLVAECYLEEYSEHLVVNHKDLDKQNDSVSNLEMVTAKQNHEHSIRNQPLAHKRRSSLTLAHVRYIYRLMLDGFTNQDIAKMLGLPRGGVARLRGGQTWAGYSSDLEIPSPTKVIDEDMARKVCEELQVDQSPSRVMRKLSESCVTLNVVKDIKRRKTWVHVSCDYDW